MVARPGTYQSSQNAGELAPEMWGRTDVKQFYAGMALMKNLEPVPQGGGRLMPRTRHIGRVRHLLQAVDALSMIIAVGPHVAAATLATVTFTAPRVVSVVRLPGFASSIPVGVILQVQWAPDGVTFTNFGLPFKSGAAAATRTIALAPGQSVTATVIRLRMVSAPTGAVTFTLPSIGTLRETTTMPPVARVRPFTFGLDQTYVAVILEGHVDFYRDGVFVSSSTVALSSGQIAAIKTQQRFDTMLLFHEDLRSQRILRNGSDSEWIVDNVPYTNTPRVDLGGSYSNQVMDIWQIYIRYPTTGSYANGANVFVSFNVSGEETPGVSTGAPNWTAFAAAVKAAVEDLASQGPGIIVTEDHGSAGVTVITIYFTGAGTLGNRNTLSAQVVNTSEAAATVTHTQLGVPGGEDLISDTAGWPACANFYQERLVTGGFKSKRGALMASVTGDYYDNNTEIISASGAILNNLDTDGAERLHHIARARHLVLFTSDAEYFISDRSLNRTVTPTVVNCSRNGSALNVPIVESEGSLLYVSRDGNLIYTATYDDVSQAYVSQPISLLASHIARGIVDLALQKPTTASDAARLWQVRDNGTMCVGVMLRNQDVTAFVRWETAGAVRSSCVDGLNVPYILVERPVGAVTELHLERLELGLIFDGTIDQTFGAPVTIVPNLGAHEGAEVWAVADGYVEGPFTVSGGSITLPEASTIVSVGRWTPPRGIPLPLPSEVAERIVLKRPKRVHTVRFQAINTTSLAIGANGRPARDVTLQRAGDPVDVPQQPVTREIPVTGLTGFSQEGQIEITQLKPGLLAWSGFTREART